MRIYFNPLDASCKNISGAVEQNKSLTFNVFHLRDEKHRDSALPYIDCVKEEDCFEPNKELSLCINKDGEEERYYAMKKTSFGWSISFSVDEIGLYFYCFSFDKKTFISCNNYEIGQISDKKRPFLLTIYKKNYQTPEWFKGGVMYQIFPDRFHKAGTMPDITGKIKRKDWGGEPYYRPNEKGKVLNNDFFGGNFKGIESKLPYLKELGVTVIYLNPIFKAYSNHRYDTGDYLQIDEILGTCEDFGRLVKTAKEYGISIILDGVFNHTGDDSVYFNKYGNYASVGAYQSEKSPYYSWYTFEKHPDKYESWWGIDILPQVNENDPGFQNHILGENGVLRHWLSYDIMGYRLDVADELPDSFLAKLRKSVKTYNKNAIIIGEVWEDASTKIAYEQRRAYFHGNELDSVMNYPWKDAIISYVLNGNATQFLSSVRQILDHYPKQTIDCLMNILGTHDTPRILTVLGGIRCKNKDEMAKASAYLTQKEKEKAIQKLKLAVILQFTLPGVPCIYYGDENAMEGDIDPFCRRCFNWDQLNAELIAFYTALGRLRETYNDIFKDGVFDACIAKDGLFLFTREKNGQKIYTYVNASSVQQKLILDETYYDILNDKLLENEIIVKPYSYKIYMKN